MGKRFGISALAALCMFMMFTVPAAASDGPHLKLSLSLPLQDTTQDDFDPGVLTYERGWRVPVPGPKPYHGTSSATEEFGSRTFGLSLQGSTDGATWLGVAWQRGPNYVTTVDSGLDYIHRLSRPCPGVAGNCSQNIWHASKGQSNRHRLREDLVSFGVKRDLLRNKRVSLAPGLGVQYQFMRDQRNLEYVLSRPVVCITTPCNPSREVSREHSVRWTSKAHLYLSLDGELYPGGKKDGLGVGFSGRYIVPGRDVITVSDRTLIQEYSVPILKQRWQSSVYLVFAY